jgi:hypothetical protein
VEEDMMDKIQIEHLREFITRDTGDSWYKTTCLRLLDELEQLTRVKDRLYIDNMNLSEIDTLEEEISVYDSALERTVPDVIQRRKLLQEIIAEHKAEKERGENE